MPSIAVPPGGLQSQSPDRTSSSVRFRSHASERPPDDRLDSWKEIAAYMKRDVTTVQRWEKREGMPVHRHVHDKLGSVYAFRTELDAWARSRTLGLSRRAVADHADAVDGVPRRPRARTAAGPVAAGRDGRCSPRLSSLWQVQQHLDACRRTRWPTPAFCQLTDFDGSEQAAALSRDGRFAAFLSDRDGQMDVWVTQVGTGQFYNLTRDAAASSSIRRFARWVSRQMARW